MITNRFLNSNVIITALENGKTIIKE